MRAFIHRWYGDRCPVWTWPATIAGIVIIMLTCALIADLAEEAECNKRGGNILKGRACYLVTQTRIY